MSQNVNNYADRTANIARGCALVKVHKSPTSSASRTSGDWHFTGSFAVLSANSQQSYTKRSSAHARRVASVILFAVVFLLAHSTTPVAAAAAVESPLSSTTVQWSYSLCTLDSQCTRMFYQLSGKTAYKQLVFQELLNLLVTTKHLGILPADLDTLATQCSNTEASLLLNSSSGLCSSSSRLWLNTMRDTAFCGPNQEYIAKKGCMCKEGKKCETDCIHVVLADMFSFTVAVVIFGFGLLWVYYWMGYRLRQLQKNYDALFQRAAKEWNTKEATLYVASTYEVRGASVKKKDDALDL